jgi:hypothetical protein
MRPIILTTLISALLFPAAAGAATSCSDIAAATVAELQAGAAEWNDTIESLVRSAAGSACVKAQSGAYTSEAAGEQAADGKVQQAVIREEQIAAATTTAVEEKDVDDGKAGWKFLGFEVNSVTGSPAEKPYERKR